MIGVILWSSVGVLGPLCEFPLLPLCVPPSDQSLMAFASKPLLQEAFPANPLSLAFSLSLCAVCISMHPWFMLNPIMPECEVHSKLIALKESRR